MTAETHRDIARRFSGAAYGYDKHARIQRDAATKLAGMIPGCAPRRILDLGCGTGALTALLAARWPAAQIEAVDAAAGMVASLKRSFPAVQARVADIAHLPANPVSDLVASNCALHWITPFETGILRAAGQLRPGGIAALSVMLDGTLRELHEARREVAPDKAAAGRMPDFDEVLRALRDAGLKRLAATEETVTGIFSSPRELFAMLREQGLTGGHLARGARPLTRAELLRIEVLYAQRHAISNGVAATYRIGYLIAAKI